MNNSYWTTPVFYVEIKGDLACRFQEWALKNKIFSVVRAGGSGPDWYTGFFATQDAEKIDQWLKEQSAQPVA